MGDDELIEAWLGFGLSRKTIALYLSALARLNRWCERRGFDLDTIGALALEDYAATVPRTFSSRSLVRHALAAYWRATGRTDGPAGAIRVPHKPRMECRALEDPQAALLARAARSHGGRRGAAVLMGLYGALRRSEIAAVRWCDIRGDWLTIVGKGDQTRVIPLHPVLADALAKLRGDEAADAWLFPSPYGGHVGGDTIYAWVRSVSDRAGLGQVPAHVLRHTALATANDASRDLRAVQELAGHARPQTTAGYTRVRSQRLRAAVMAIDYGEAV